MHEETIQKSGRIKGFRKTPVRFWWPVLVAFLIIGLLSFLIPFDFFLSVDRRPMLVPVRQRQSAAAFVQITPEYAQEAMRKIRSIWSTDRQNEKLSFEMSLVDLGEKPNPIWSLRAGTRYPGKWMPEERHFLPLMLPPIPVPVSLASPPIGTNAFPSVRLPVLRIRFSDPWREGDFSFTPPPTPYPDASGSGTFYVETDETGRVVHLLLFSPRSQTLSLFEQAIYRGRAKGASSGKIYCEWKTH